MNKAEFLLKLYKYLKINHWDEIINLLRSTIIYFKNQNSYQLIFEFIIFLVIVYFAYKKIRNMAEQ